MPALSTLPCLPDAASTPIGAEVLRGLTANPKTLSPWLFYDQRGSQLFEAITELPEYYLTRTEREIFAAHADEILAATGAPRINILELGAGTAAKTGLLLDAAVRRQGSVHYRPIDISGSALEEAGRRIGEQFPYVTVQPHLADYVRDMSWLPHASGRRLVLYIGSSIGNFEPRSAASLLRNLRRNLAPGDLLLLGVDHIKDRNTLLRAYNDSAGVTASFNRNILTRINRELAASFRPGLFRHRAIWNDREHRIEMHLESLVSQTVNLRALDLTVQFVRGESIHTENSYKFTPDSVSGLLAACNFARRGCWTDKNRWFGVYLAEAA